MQLTPNIATNHDYKVVRRVTWRGLADAWQHSETLLVMLTSSLVLFVMTLPAFRTFFLAEDFVYLGVLQALGGDFWRAAVSPMGGIFFRPVFFIVSVPWQFVLPPDPVWFHLRNYALTLLNVFLLHRILFRFSSQAGVRLLALALFVVSKIHLQTIGFIGNYESVVALALVLGTILCLLRYFEAPSRLRYGLAVAVLAVSVWTRDYGLVVVFVALALSFAWVHTGKLARRHWRWWAVRLSPFPVIVVAYMVTRYAAVGPPPSSAVSPEYSPQFIPLEAAYKIWILTATVGNVAFGMTGVTGSGVGPATLSLAPWLGARAAWIDGLLYAALACVLLVTVWQVRRVGWAVVFPLIWMGAYFGPTLFVRNLQMYYMYDAVAAAALMLCMCLNVSVLGIRRLWTAALIVIACVGLISNHTSLYAWQYAAAAAQRTKHPVVDLQRDKPLQSITFVADDVPFWKWTLTANGIGPMIPYLLNQPNVTVMVVDKLEIGRRALPVDDANRVFDVEGGFQPYDPFQARAQLTLHAIWPSGAQAGRSFNLQPNGQSAMGITAEGATSRTRVVLNGKVLESAYAAPTYLSAVVPDDLLAIPGVYELYLLDGEVRTNSLRFVVTGE